MNSIRALWEAVDAEGNVLRSMSAIGERTFDPAGDIYDMPATGWAPPGTVRLVLETKPGLSKKHDGGIDQ